MTQTQSGLSDVQVWNDPHVAPSHASIGGGSVVVVVVVVELVVLDVVVVGEGDPSAPALSKKLSATGAVQAMPTPIPSFLSAARRESADRSSGVISSIWALLGARVAATSEGPPEACPTRSLTHSVRRGAGPARIIREIVETESSWDL